MQMHKVIWFELGSHVLSIIKRVTQISDSLIYNGPIILGLQVLTQVLLGLPGLFNSLIQSWIVGLSGPDCFQNMAGFVLGVFSFDHRFIKLGSGLRAQSHGFTFGGLNELSKLIMGVLQLLLGTLFKLFGFIGNIFTGFFAAFRRR